MNLNERIKVCLIGFTFERSGIQLAVTSWTWVTFCGFVFVSLLFASSLLLFDIHSWNVSFQFLVRVKSVWKCEREDKYKKKRMDKKGFLLKTWPHLISRFSNSSLTLIPFSLLPLCYITRCKFNMTFSPQKCFSSFSRRPPIVHFLTSCKP